VIELFGGENREKGFWCFFDVAADIVIDDPDMYQSGGAMPEEEMG
jgi:hypothetical protein